MSTLSEPVLDAVGAAASLSSEAVKLVAAEYEKMWGVIQAPNPASLTIEDAPFIAKIGMFSPTTDQTWENFKARMSLRMQQETDIANPYLPMWSQKAEGSMSPWLVDSGSIEDEKAKAELSGIIRMCTPALNKSLYELFANTTPVGPAPNHLMFEIADAMATVPYIFLNDRGASGTPDPLWRWGSTLCQLSFLGLPAMRRFFSHFPLNEDLTHWATCPMRELFDDIMKAREKTSYPCGLHYLDFGALGRVLHRLSFKEPGTNQVRTPQWYSASVALHLFKHVRYWSPYSGQPARLVAAYRGKYTVLPLADGDALHQDLMSSANLSVTRQICNILGMPMSTAKSGKVEWFETMIARTLSNIKPHHLPPARHVDTLTELIVPPGVRITQAEKTRVSGWICTDLQVSNVARVDVRTGKVDTEAVITGPDALAYRWPLETLKATEYSRWSSTVPKEVVPRRASEVLRKWIRNINDMGHWDGFAAVLDSIMTLAMLRTEIGGCPVGNSMDKEFPLVFVLPTGSTADETTNQGKTTLCRVIAGALMPGVEVTLFSRFTSAPAQRAMIGDLERFYGGILDEFILPRSPEHVLNQAGLQSIATGNNLPVGKAGENAKPFKLRYPLFFNAKVAPDVPDLMNRIVPIFLDALTPETKLPEEALQAIMSGYASVEMRASHLMWMQQQRVREIICGWTENVPDGRTVHHHPLKLVTGSWRFNAHLAVAYGLASRDAVDGYFKTAREYCATQLAAADLSGLTEDIGYRAGFDPHYYWSHADATTLEILATTTKTEATSPINALRAIVEDGKRRVFGRVMMEHGMREQHAGKKFNEALGRGTFVRDDGWVMRLDKKRVYVERSVPSEADKLAAAVSTAGAAALKAIEAKKPELPPPPPKSTVYESLSDLIPNLLPMPTGIYEFAQPDEETPHIGDLKTLLPGLSDVGLPDFNDL